MKSTVTRYEVTTEYPIPQPIRIAHVSDLHERRADDIIDLLKAEKPDLIVVTGDTLERYDNRPQYNFDRRPIKRVLITSVHWLNYLLCKFQPDSKKAKTENAYRFFRQAVHIAPVYLSLGNHEQKLEDGDLRFYCEQGIHLLDNAAARVEVKGFSMLIGGMSSWDFEEFLSDFARQKGFKLLLCHHPERYALYVCGTGVDLTLSGHTHGGQIPVGRQGRGLFVPGQGLLGKYAHGRFFDGRLIVSAGCANTTVVPRWGNPRELVMVTLKGKEDGTV